MSRSFTLLSARCVVLTLAAAVLAVAAPSGRTQSQAPAATSPTDPYPNFDIRTYKDDPGLANSDALAAYMDAVAKPAPSAADALAGSRNALVALRTELPGIRVEAHGLGGAAIVSAMPGTAFLTAPGDDRVATLRGFLQGHAAAFGLAGDQVETLAVVADEMNPAGNMAWVELEQRINGIKVFQGHMRGAFTAKGELARTNGLLATGVGAGLSVSPALSATQAVAIAAANVSLPATSLRERTRDGDFVVFERGAMASEPRAWLVYFPLAHGVARLAWAVEVFGDPLGFLTVVDAETGTVVFRKNLTEFQTQAATYNVYTGDSPAPASPSPALPGANYVAPVVARVDDTLIGNEAPNTFNNLGWITDGNNIDRRQQRRGRHRSRRHERRRCAGGRHQPRLQLHLQSRARQPGAGDDPLTLAYQRGEVTNMFYWANRYHDDTYRLGFTEGVATSRTTTSAAAAWRAIASAPRPRTPRAPTTPTSRRRPTAAAAACRCSSGPARRPTAAAASTPTSCCTS